MEHMPWVFQVHIGGIVPAPQIPSLSDEAGFAAHVTRRGSNIDLAPIHLPRVSVRISGDAPDAQYRDAAQASPVPTIKRKTLQSSSETSRRR